VIAFLAHFLIVLAAWTVTIEFLFPIAYARGVGAPLDTFMYWAVWGVVHLWLAWALLRWQPYTYALAIGVSVVEILIIVTKFALFLPDPTWTIWTTNWFINKLFVLACFCLMLPYFLVYGRRDRATPQHRLDNPSLKSGGSTEPYHLARTNGPDAPFGLSVAAPSDERPVGTALLLAP
jgi:hypothetical protein